MKKIKRITIFAKRVHPLHKILYLGTMFFAAWTHPKASACIGCVHLVFLSLLAQPMPWKTLAGIMAFAFFASLGFFIAWKTPMHPYIVFHNAAYALTFLVRCASLGVLLLFALQWFCYQDIIYLARTFRIPGYLFDIAYLMYTLSAFLCKKAMQIYQAQNTRLGYSPQNMRTRLRSFSLLVFNLLSNSLHTILQYEKGISCRSPMLTFVLPAPQYPKPHWALTLLLALTLLTSFALYIFTISQY